MGNPSKLFIARVKAATESPHGAMAEFCRASGVVRNTVKSWLSGESSPTLETIERVADALGISPAELLSAPAAEPSLHARRLEVIARLASLKDNEIGRVIPGMESILRNLPKEHIQVRDKNSEST